MTTSLPDLCDQCGIGKFEIVQLGAETAKTCTNCGYYCNNIELQFPNCNDPGYSNSNSVSLSKKYKATIGAAAISQHRLTAIKQIRAYLDNYPKNLCLHETAEALFLKSWEGVRVGKLATFAAATLIIVLREAGQSVFIKEIADFFGAATHDVSKKMLYIKSYYGVSVPMTSIEHFVTRYLSNCSGIGDVDKVKDLSLSLCGLFKKIHLGTSPKTTSLLAIYHATIALAGKIPAMTVTEFFKRTSLQSGCCGFDRSTVILRNKMIIMAKRLPWASNVNKRNYHTFIHGIIKHESLIMHIDVNGAVSKKPTLSCDVSEYAESSKCVTNSSVNDSNRPILSEQMQLELPSSCVKNLLNPKPVIPDVPLPIPVSDSEILVEKDCPETELRKYLRTDEEINIYLKLKNTADD